jgi:YhhN-like protein
MFLLPSGRTTAYSWLLGTLILWATLLFGGFAFGTFTGSREQIPTPARMGSSFVLVVAAWSWYKLARPTRVGRYSFLIALGMTFGFVGDLFMAGLISAGEPMFGGMGSFGVGHIAYLSALLYLGNVTGLTDRRLRWLAWLTWLLIGVPCWYRIVYCSNPPPALGWAALGYVLFLASTAGCASGLALQARALWPLACGAALFFVSDLMIAAQQFGGLNSATLESAIWLTYGPAQMLIVYSSATALSLSRATPAAVSAGAPSFSISNLSSGPR